MTLRPGDSITKDPDAVLKYVMDWSDWLDTGETISTSTWTVDSGITKDSDTNTTTTATITLSGGTVGEKYRITNRIVTSGSQTDDRSFYVYVNER
jgi:hypothetical protein